ncbi:myb-like protein Z [Planococcus citri]|uniref:myb-like protein Z n=1 Tax=Planococcus citri TaxID=170843 RepID=UPI0031F7FF08
MDKSNKTTIDSDTSSFSDHSHIIDKEGSSEDENAPFSVIDEGIGTQNVTPPFDYEKLRDNTNDKVYQVFKKTWKWNEAIHSEVRANHIEFKDEISKNAKSISETKNDVDHLKNKISEVKISSDVNNQMSNAKYAELSSKLEDTQNNINDANNNIFENKMDIKTLSDSLRKVEDNAKIRDEGCDQLVNHLNIVKQAIRRPLHTKTAKAKSLAIDAGSVRNAGITFADEHLHFPHEFLQEFDDYFAETNAVEKHKIFAFKGVIATKDRKEFLETVRNVNNYRELKQKFLDFYWDRRAQNEAMKFCRYDFVVTENAKDMANQMTRWARSLKHHRHGNDEEIIEILIGKAPEQYQWILSEEGQTLDQFLTKLNKVSRMQRDPDNEVPIIFRRNQKRFDDYNGKTPSKPRFTSTQALGNDQLQSLLETIAKKLKPTATNSNYNRGNYQNNNSGIPKSNYERNNNNNPTVTNSNYNRGTYQNNNNTTHQSNKNSTTYQPKDKSDPKSSTQNTSQLPKNTSNSNSTNYSKPFDVDKGGNLVMKRFNPKTPSTIPLPVKTVQIDEEDDDDVIIQTPLDDSTDLTAVCNMLNTLFENTDEIDSQQITAAVQMLTTKVSDPNTEEEASSGNESH